MFVVRALSEVSFIDSNHFSDHNNLLDKNHTRPKCLKNYSKLISLIISPTIYWESLKLRLPKRGIVPQQLLERREHSHSEANLGHGAATNICYHVQYYFTRGGGWLGSGKDHQNHHNNCANIT